jgi:hypothetical protein
VTTRAVAGQVTAAVKPRHRNTKFTGFYEYGGP